MLLIYFSFTAVAVLQKIQLFVEFLKAVCVYTLQILQVFSSAS